MPSLDFLRPRRLLSATLAVWLAGCSGSTPLQHQQYDFGPFTTVAVPASQLRLSLAEIQVPAALDGNAMLYRLQYDNGQQLKPYAQARWSMAPAQLLAQRLKLQLGARGGLVLGAADGAANLPLLRIDLNEFSQVFTSPTNSHAMLSARAVLLKERAVLGQRNFLLQIPAASPDAAGGARAMQQAADSLIGELQNWLASLPLP